MVGPGIGSAPGGHRLRRARGGRLERAAPLARPLYERYFRGELAQRTAGGGARRR